MCEKTYIYSYTALNDWDEEMGTLYVETMPQIIIISTSNISDEILEIEVYPDIAREIAAAINKAADEVEGKV